MKRNAGSSPSNLVRRHAQDKYVRPAQALGKKSFAINVGEVHKSVALRNRVPLVCQALESAKFLQANALRLVSRSGPPSGQSTTVTYTYEFIHTGKNSGEDGWIQLRGAFKDIFAELGGGEAYLRAERGSFYPPKGDE